MIVVSRVREVGATYESPWYMCGEEARGRSKFRLDSKFSDLNLDLILNLVLLPKNFNSRFFSSKPVCPSGWADLSANVGKIGKKSLPVGRPRIVCRGRNTSTQAKKWPYGRKNWRSCAGQVGPTILGRPADMSKATCMCKFSWMPSRNFRPTTCTHFFLVSLYSRYRQI